VFLLAIAALWRAIRLIYSPLGDFPHMGEDIFRREIRHISKTGKEMMDCEEKSYRRVLDTIC